MDERFDLVRFRQECLHDGRMEERERYAALLAAVDAVLIDVDVDHTFAAGVVDIKLIGALREERNKLKGE